VQTGAVLKKASDLLAESISGKFWLPKRWEYDSNYTGKSYQDVGRL
jgi:hypothetical protein